MVIEKCDRCVVSRACGNKVARECLPVPGFGDFSAKKLQVVTIGLNPALNEFYLNGDGKARDQRLAILKDYKVFYRNGLSDTDINDPTARREGYFRNTGRWWHSYFERLESVLSRANQDWSYVTGSAAHIDLVACATRDAWNKLLVECQAEMLTNCRDHFLGTLSRVPSGTLLLFDGARVTQEIYNSGIYIEQQGGEQLINIRLSHGKI